MSDDCSASLSWPCQGLHCFRMIAPLRHAWQSVNLEYQRTAMRCISQSMGVRYQNCQNIEPQATSAHTRSRRRVDRIANMSAFGPYRTSLVALHMSASDTKRTLLAGPQA